MSSSCSELLFEIIKHIIVSESNHMIRKMTKLQQYVKTLEQRIRILESLQYKPRKRRESEFKIYTNLIIFTMRTIN